MSGLWAKGFVCAGTIILGFGLLAWARGENAGREENVLRLTADDSGREVTVKAGERFEVALSEIPGGGYLWAVHRADPEYLRLEGETYADAHPDKERVGAKRQKVFTFQALKAGKTTLELWLRRPWDEADKHLESFEVKIKIEAKGH